MKVLLIHPNFPAQLRHVAGALGSAPGNVVVFATSNPRPEWTIPGVSKVLIKEPQTDDLKPHRLAGPMQDAVVRGEAMHRTAFELNARGFKPDVIYANSGWGSTLYLKDIWPDVPLLCYFEWFYDPQGADALFDGPPQPGAYRAPALLRSRNASIFNDLWSCDAGLSPTQWQKSQFPAEYHDRITVLHDGVDTEFFKPEPGRPMDVGGLDLAAGDEVVTFAGRGMEPYRGFPQFMKAVELLQKRRERLHVVVAGTERICYGPVRPDGKSWKEVMLQSLDLDESRLHFVGSLPYGEYRTLLQASHCHVYLTRPFVLSWSFIEAMACGCALAASDTEPVREVASHGDNALLFDFFKPEELADRVEQILDDRALAERLSGNARQTALTRFALKKLLPLHMKLTEQIAIRGLQRRHARIRSQD